MARALLMQPSMAAFGLWGSRAFAYLQRTTTLRRSYHLSSSRSLLLLRAAVAEASPIGNRRRNFCIRATNEYDSSASVESSLIQSMENKVLHFVLYILFVDFYHQLLVLSRIIMKPKNVELVVSELMKCWIRIFYNYWAYCI